MSSTVLPQVEKQRQLLKSFLDERISMLAQQCVALIDDSRTLDKLLASQVNQSSLRKYL